LKDPSFKPDSISACIERIHKRLAIGDIPSNDVIHQEATRAKLTLPTIEAMLRLDKRFIHSSSGWKVQPISDKWPDMALVVPTISSTDTDSRNLFRQVIVEMNTNLRENFNEYFPNEFSDSLQHRITQLIAIYTSDNISLCKGHLFDLIMSEVFDDANRNRYFTPRAICTIASIWAQPKPGDKIMDPCYGSGGFLLAMAQQLERSASQDGNTSHDYKAKFENSNTTVMNLPLSYNKIDLGVYEKMLYGMDIDPAASWAGEANLALHAFGGSCLKQADALDLNISSFPLESFDIVTGNPSFGDKITDPAILDQFELGHDSKGHLLNQQYSDILFIEAFIRYAKPGGKVIILVPDGTLTNHGCQVVRDLIIEQTLVEAVIGLPRRVFRNDAKSNILLLRKKTSLDEHQQYPVFLSAVNNIITELPESLIQLLVGSQK
jgi:type I restriction-modification system DNA methylase subunit